MKKIFKKKEPTDEQNRAYLEESGVPINAGYNRPSKFGQYSGHARDLMNQRTGGAGGSYGNGNSGSNGSSLSNPYARAGASLKYQSSISSAPPPSYRTNGAPSNYSNSRESGNRYNDPGNRYGDSSTNAYGSSASTPTSSPYASAETAYAARFGKSNSTNNLARTETMDSYTVNRDELLKGARQRPTTPNGAGGLPGRSAMTSSSSSPAISSSMSAQDDLFATPSELDREYNANVPKEQQTTLIDSEEEDVEAIKGQIRFTKQQSVQSSRNALRMAAEAEESGKNALGMLGAQGERITNTEHNLNLATTQNKIAAEKAKELKTVSGSMFAVHVQNPFTKSKRLAEREEQIKADRRQGQATREALRQEAYNSEQRISQGLGQQPSELTQKYRKQAGRSERSKYQFDADSEDEEMENEIDSNLNALNGAAGRLNKLAIVTGQEVERQNDRLDRIADSTDTLDVNVHLNTSRLANIK